MTSFMLSDTTASKISSQLTHLRHQMGSPAVGMVLTLVVVCDEGEQYDAVRAATEAAREHPSRILVVIARDPAEPNRLDAELRVGESTPGEVILLRLYGELTRHADSVVSPLLLTDTPVVAWWPRECPDVPAKDPIGALAQRRIVDARPAAEPVKVLASRTRSYVPGDTDLAWTRLTPWRSLLAAAFDQPVGKVKKGVVEAAAGHPSAPLLAAWLGERLGAPVKVTESGGPGLTRVVLSTADGDIAITRSDARLATLSRPGQPDRQVALARRPTSELIAEELRRLDPDEVYEAAIRRVSKTVRS
ncbi:glucose-6-phosphate dehydrogenase assembly protein OpcA [Planomonospora venezuelensis]|uniref:Glucose-6-phosphate dehydrogenase assembly protein OpcA n=1 Tax=Planomonospora venezuelensis TaxID=1999 RepID=A0A841D398_PLAVE|nr:glucose-6-phosphate dehydrogenase assembly protein OpcA [Planomonospora venezuelensis]MBB5963443.1 glucose-6-phosphate dehydrogenase assembly protein OpcA [Planomonospora venezuelensis]GIN05509.1 glucose-6-phosphate dehydrogenase assembly protein OpcA [Planomonospora venezuelensis]